MEPGDKLAEIAESQIGIRGDLQSGREALYGYLLATGANLGAFGPEWVRPGFGSSVSTRFSLLDPDIGKSKLRLLPDPPAREPPIILRMHSWCAAFVDWCVLQLLMTSPNATKLTLSQRPQTALAFGLLEWGKAKNCGVVAGTRIAPQRGDIVIFNFSHTGIVTRAGKGHFYSVEGNTTPASGGNQGFIVANRARSQMLLKGFVRLPPRHILGDFEITSAAAQTV